MKKLSLIFCLLVSLNLSAQKLNKLPESTLPMTETSTHLRFLAADELMGRRTGEQGNMVAARYIAEQFRAMGLKPAAGQSSFYQKVPFKNTAPNTEGSLSIGDSTLKMMTDFIVLDGKASDLKGLPVVFAGNGWVDKETDDYKDLDVKGKIVIVSLGTPKTTSPWEAIQASELKTKIAAEHGAAALVELFTAKLPWKNVVGYFASERLKLDMKKAGEPDNAMPHLWVSGNRAALLAKDKVQTLSLTTFDKKETPVLSCNVVGVLEGTDPVLKNEYVILSAHFDHVGTGKNGGQAFTKEDSIFNGARDDAFGCTAVLYAAKCLSQIKTKRSILFIAFTGEEIGLLGSSYYAENPLVPLKQCVYDLNCDGAGYNDTTLLTTIGLNRTDCKTELEIASKAFGLKIMDDPAPEQNLFDRSDNVSFAAKGIPAPTFAPGFTAFDDAIFKYYHQATDNPETINFTYLHKHCQVFAYAARLIANRKDQPKWIANDKYETAYKTLYGK
jgi:Peptidase family M28